MTLEHYPAQIAEHAVEHGNVDACRRLWRRVIEQAIADQAYLARFERTDHLAKHELERVRRIEECPPADFLAGDWFEEICGHLGVDPALVRAGLQERMEGAA